MRQSSKFGVCLPIPHSMPCGGTLKLFRSSQKDLHKLDSRSSQPLQHWANRGMYISQLKLSHLRSGNWISLRSYLSELLSTTISPALRSTTSIPMSVLAEVFRSHLDGGLGSWSILVVSNSTLALQRLWRVSRMPRKDLFKQQVSLSNCSAAQHRVHPTGGSLRVF